MSAPALLADAILVLHLAVVLFVVGGQALVIAGGLRGWGWVRRRSFRIAHLAVIGFVVVQTWLGQHCPLTVWEQALRRAAGQAAYGESFIEHWVSRILFYQAPWPVFVATYTLFAALVLASWRWWPPRPRRRESGPGTGA